MSLAMRTRANCCTLNDVCRNAEKRVFLTVNCSNDGGGQSANCGVGEWKSPVILTRR